MEHVVLIIDWILYALFAVNVLYLLVYSLASLVRKPRKTIQSQEYKHFAILIAAYREDAVILDTVRTCLKQNYPTEKYDIVVISDHMRPETNEQLRTLPVKLLQVDFEKSTNTKSLKEALLLLGENTYDVALVIDADNIIAPSYLLDVNNAFANPEVKVVQTHRVAKNLNTDMAYLDAISEEINNSIFRLGHVNLGMSAALIGSGMAFQYPLFYTAMMSNTSIGGFDRVLEMKLLLQNVFFHYLPDTYVLDEKIQSTQKFYLQRRRWLSAQYISFLEFVSHLPYAIRTCKWGFCDKLYQQASLSRVLLLGFTFLIALSTSFISSAVSSKWWWLLVIILLALLFAVPRKFWTPRLLRAMLLLPYSFLLMFLNLFRMKEGVSKFMHTEHGIEEGE